MLTNTQNYRHGCYFAYINDYLKDKSKQTYKVRLAFILFIISFMLALLALTKPLFASNPPNAAAYAASIQNIDTGQTVMSQSEFKQSILARYPNSKVTFPTQGIAHIKKVKYINSKPIKINIVEINTNVNPNLKIKPQIASTKLNSKSTVRKIANSSGAIVALNGGFFKPQTGVPLGALMIDGEILTGPIYNRVGIGIFENEGETYFKMDNINFDMKATTKSGVIKIDNINQPRMLSSYNIIYTSIWGEYCPVAKGNNQNLLIQGNKPVKVSANPIKIGKNDIILQADKETIRQIIKDKEIYISIKLQEGFEQASHIIAAGPYLVKNSQIYVDVKTQKLNAISGKNPRSAIGFRDDMSLVLVTVDGREETSVGMTLFELAKFMKNLGCTYAMNFDGGSSSSMYVKGSIVNSALNKEGAAVSNALIVSEINKDEIQISSLNQNIN